jgi:multiple sugar transport system ATP-binding protein
LYGNTDIDGTSAEIVSRVDGSVHPHAGETVTLNIADGIIHIFDIESGLRLN